jgi:uncharacterized membrane protein
MKSLLLPLHLLSIGIWLGCVLTEALFERALLGRGREQELLLARLHKRVDLVVEIPAFLLVLVTGVFMLPVGSPSLLLHAKIGFGLLAVAANAYCVWLVFRRFAHASAGNWEAFARADYLQHKVGAIVLVGILTALGIGLYLHVHA